VTTPRVDAVDMIAAISLVRDKESLQVISRILDAEVTVAEAQLNQLRQVRAGLDDRMKSM
jgi:hypothetical protein